MATREFDLSPEEDGPVRDAGAQVHGSLVDPSGVKVIRDEA